MWSNWFRVARVSFLCQVFVKIHLGCRDSKVWSWNLSHSIYSLSWSLLLPSLPLLPQGRSPQIGTVINGGCQKKEHHFADYLMRFEMIYSHFSQNQTTLSLSNVQNKFAPLSFYVCHTNILGFEAFLSSEIWFGLSYSITIAAFCMPNILVYQDQESVHK